MILAVGDNKICPTANLFLPYGFFSFALGVMRKRYNCILLNKLLFFIKEKYLCIILVAAKFGNLKKEVSL